MFRKKEVFIDLCDHKGRRDNGGITIAVKNVQSGINGSVYDKTDKISL